MSVNLLCPCHVSGCQLSSSLELHWFKNEEEKKHFHVTTSIFYYSITRYFLFVNKKVTAGNISCKVTVSNLTRSSEMNIAPYINNHLGSIYLFRSMII